MTRQGGARRRGPGRHPRGAGRRRSRSRCAAQPVRSGGTAVLTESGAFKALTLDLAERDRPAAAARSARRTAAAMRAAMPDFIPVIQSDRPDRAGAGRSRPLSPHARRRCSTTSASAASCSASSRPTRRPRARKFPPIIDAVEALAPDKPVIFAGLDEGAPVPADYIAAACARSACPISRRPSAPSARCAS